MSGQEIFRAQVAKILQRQAQPVVLPIPPGKPVHAFADLFRKALADGDIRLTGFPEV